MITKHRNLYNSITTRLVIAFLLIVMPMQVTAYLIFNWSSNRLQTSIEQDAITNADFLHNKITAELDSVMQQVSSLLNDPAITSLVYQQSSMMPAQLYTTLKATQDRLTIVRNSSLILQEIYILFSENRKILLYDDYYTGNEQDFAYIVEQLREQNTFYAIINGTINLADLYPTVSRFSQEYPKYLVCATLSSDLIAQYLSEFSDSRQKNTVLYQPGSDFCIFGHSNLIDGEKVLQLLHTIDLPAASEAFRIATYSQGDETYYTVAHNMPLIDCVLVQAVPITQIYEQQNLYHTYMTLFITLSIALFIIYAVLTRRLVHNPVDKLITGFTAISNGQYDVKINLQHPANEFHNLINNFNRMAAQLDEVVNKLYRQEIYVKQIELKQLQMQINPHFLYNSFFMLSRLVDQEDLESARRLAEHLGEYFQFITRNDNDQVPLYQEWQHTKSYLDIQAIRFERRLVFEIEEVPLDYRGFLVPRLILQPIVENALEHGLKHKMSNGRLSISFIEKADGLYVFVEDNGDEMTDQIIQRMQARLSHDADAHEETTALINIHRRLHLAYGPAYGLTFRSRPSGGLQVELRLPLLPEHRRLPELPAADATTQRSNAQEE